MKKVFLLVTTCMACTILVQAQFQIKNTVTTTPTKTAPVVVNKSNKTLTPININMPAGNPVAIVNIGNGKNMRAEMVRDTRSWSADDNYHTTVKSSSPSPNSSAQWNCTSKNIQVSAESMSFMPAIQNLNSINVGTIYKFEDFYSGSMNEVTAGRRPFTMYTENIRTTGPVTQVVNDPKGSTINSTLHNIVQPFSNTIGSSRLIYRTFTSENEADFKLKVTAGGSYGAFTANASYNLSTNEKHVYLTFDVSKPMFKVIAERPEQGFFNDPSFVAANPSLIYIKEVQYGTRVLVNLDIVVTSREDIAKISASYGLGDTTKKTFSASMDVINTLKSAKTTVNAYVAGAPQTITILDKAKLEEQITALVATCNYGTAEPIMYRLADMNGNTIGVKSATDEFTIQDCTPATSIFMLQSARVSVTSGDDNKEYPSTFGTGLFKLLTPDPNGAAYMLYSSDQRDHVAELAAGQTESFSMSKNTPPANAVDLFNLNSFANGGRLEIHYSPNFGLDAWRINDVILTLTFVDQNNAQVVKTIKYNNIGQLLNSQYKMLECKITPTFENGGTSIKP